MAVIIQRSRNPVVAAAFALLAGGAAPKKKALAAPKEEPLRSEPYRRLVAARACENCGWKDSQAAHPPPTGKGIKEDDRLCFALCIPHKVGRKLVEGCHAAFDQYRLIPKEKMAATAAKWARRTQDDIFTAGDWPRGLPLPDRLARRAKK